MKQQNGGAEDPNDIIDLAEYAQKGEKPPKGKRYRTTVDGRPVIFDRETVTGEEVLKAAGLVPTECYSLYLKQKHCEFELIRLQDKVDLTEKAVEHFVSKPPIVFHYSVDGEPETTQEQLLTPNQILELAGITPVKDYYLVKVDKEGGQQVSYKDTPDTPIRMECPAVRYISVFRGETPVS